MPRNHVYWPIPEKHYRIFESWWKETTLFWLGSKHISDITKEEFIEFLINFNDGCFEQNIHRGFYDFRAYFLVASGLGEFKVSNIEFSNQIVIGLLDFSFGCYYQEYQQFRQFPDVIAETARISLQKTDRHIAIKFLKARYDFFEKIRKYYAQNGINSHQYKYWNNLSQLAYESLYKLNEELIPYEKNAVELQLECKIDLDKIILDYLEIDDNQLINDLSLKMNSQNYEFVSYFIACYFLKQSYSRCQKLAKQKLIHLMKNSRNMNIRKLAAFSFLELVPKDFQVRYQAIDILIYLLRYSTTDMASQVTNSLIGQISNFSIQEIKRFVCALKDCIKLNIYEQNSGLYLSYYKILWYCAEYMSYPEFYYAWHSQPCLDIKELPTTLQNAIANNSQVNQAIHLVCVDSAKFSDLDNPALDIYIEMIEQNCPEREKGEPETLSQLKSYLRVNLNKLEKKVVLLFYTSEPDSLFSESFLNTLKTFGGVIALVSNQSCDNIQCFYPEEPNLVENIMKWIKRMVLES